MPLRRSTLILALVLAVSACASVAPPPSTSVIPIGAVQGSGASSPMLGKEVSVEGTVTADFSIGLGVWAIQGASDGDAATSDAIFLDATNTTDALRIGQRLHVNGRVTERDTGNGASITVLEHMAHEVIQPASAQPPARSLSTVPADAAAWEALEAMRVTFPQALTLVGTHNAARFGEWQVALGERAWTPTEIALPGQAANALAKENRARMFWLDDGDARKTASTAMQRDIPRTGSVIEAVTGIVDERFGRHRLQLDAAPRPATKAAPPPAPPRQGDIRIAAMNLENLFNGDGNGGGFPTERGARTHASYLQQRAKLVAALAALDADAVALMELENDGEGPQSSQAQLLVALNAVHGGDWRAVPMPANASTDAIRVGIIHRASKLQAVGNAATFDEGPFARSSRPPLLQSFRAGRGPVLTLVANHFKSKGCRDAKGADADQRDGQSCWNTTRLASAKMLDGWLRQRFSQQPDAAIAILGDLNAYAMEDPPRWLRENGWRDAFAEAGVSQPYSYVYDGQSGRLDHALLSPALATRLAGAAEWHINADQADAPEAPDNPVTPLRSSDHDPLVIDLRLRE